MTLQEMMQAAASGQGPRYAGGAPSAGGGGVMTGAPPGLDPQIEALIGEATASEPYAAQPVPEKSKLWQRILSAVADAGGAYASGMGAGRPTNFTQQLLGRDDFADQATAANAAGKERSIRQSKKQAAELKLRAVLAQQERDLAATMETAKEEAARRKIQEQRTYNEGRDALQRVQDLADKQAANARADVIAGRNQRWDEHMARLNNDLRDPENKVAEKQKKELVSGMDIINETASALPGILHDGWLDAKGNPQKAVTPAQIEKQVKLELNKVIDPEVRKQLEAYYEKEVLSQIENEAHRVGRANDPGAEPLVVPGYGP